MMNENDSTPSSKIQNTKRGNEWWDRYFLGLAKYVSTASKDPSTKVGAVLVKDRKVVGMGFNGLPKGIKDSTDRLNDRETKLKMVVHAEVNAILQAGEKADGATLYVYPSFAFPPICNDCCKMALNAGVAGIVGYEPDPEDPRVVRWKDSIKVSEEMWTETNKFIRRYPENVV